MTGSTAKAFVDSENASGVLRVTCRLYSDVPKLRETLYDLKAEPSSGTEGIEPKFARNFIGFKSPVALTKAQALNHLADVFAANYEILGARDMQPKDLNYALNAFRFLATESLKQASRQFRQNEHKHISNKIDAVIDALGTKLWRCFGLDVERYHVQAGEQLNNLKNGCSKAASLLRGDAAINPADLQRFTDMRIAQVRAAKISQGQAR